MGERRGEQKEKSSGKRKNGRKMIGSEKGGKEWIKESSGCRNF